MSFEAGDKVQYFYRNKWHDGVVHGVKKVENTKGRVLSRSYLVDTGKVDSEVVTKVSEKTGKVLEKQAQPHQVEVTPEAIRTPEK